MVFHTCTSAFLLILVSSAVTGIYFTADYYMDDDWPSSFGQVCGESIQDDSAFINSHLNTFGMIDYDSNIHCTAMLDAGTQRGARYKLKWQRFELESSINCSADSLALHDQNVGNATMPFGVFCGHGDPNVTGFPTQQYVTIKFNTDGGGEDNGFRFLAVRTLPYPCSSDYFHCKAENRCIDERLQCDGIVQCDDETDEDGCSFGDKLLGGFLALGVAGIVGIVGMCLFVCTSVGVTICVCTCCKPGCTKCWGSICGPVKAQASKIRGRVAPSKRHTGIDQVRAQPEVKKDRTQPDVAESEEVVTRKQPVTHEDMEIGVLNTARSNHGNDNSGYRGAVIVSPVPGQVSEPGTGPASAIGTVSGEAGN